MLGLSADSDDLKALARVLRSEEDGKKLRRELLRNLRAALEPAKEEVKSGLMGMATAGIPVAGPPLRASVLKQMKVEARLSGRSAGVRLRIRKRGMPRGFDNAPKRLNRKKGWRHPVIGTGGEVWVQQIGEPDYFDRPTRQRRAEYRAAVRNAMQETARRITRKV